MVDKEKITELEQEIKLLEDELGEEELRREYSLEELTELLEDKEKEINERGSLIRLEKEKDDSPNPAEKCVFIRDERAIGGLKADLRRAKKEFTNLSLDCLKNHWDRLWVGFNRLSGLVEGKRADKFYCYQPQWRELFVSLYSCYGELKELHEKFLQQEENGWFVPQGWLVDNEIDGALEQTNSSNPRFGVLQGAQFSALQNRDETTGQGFLSRLNNSGNELLFIPVNNDNVHWSLLVYEPRIGTFYHYDTVYGTNLNYVEQLLQRVFQFNNADLSLFHMGGLQQQNNGYDCGVAVIAVAQRIMERYQRGMDLAELALGSFDFEQTRNNLRQRGEESNQNQEQVAQILQPTNVPYSTPSSSK